MGAKKFQDVNLLPLVLVFILSFQTYLHHLPKSTPLPFPSCLLTFPASCRVPGFHFVVVVVVRLQTDVLQMMTSE